MSMDDRSGFGPSEAFVYRGRGSIPRNARRVEVDRSVKFIPDDLFRGCRQLEFVLLHEGLLGIGRWAFINCSSLRSFRCPSTVTEIGVGAFAGCSNLTAVELSEGLRAIVGWTFAHCRSLEEVRIPALVTQIIGPAFFDCTNLASVDLPEGLRKIWGCAFKGCRSLGSLRVPSSVDEIGENAFGDCTSLALIRLHEDLPKIKRSTFRGCPLESFRFVGLLERMEAMRMDDQIKSMFDSRLREITRALTRADHDGNRLWANEEDRAARLREITRALTRAVHDRNRLWANEEDEAAKVKVISEKCKESLGRAHEHLTYLELKEAAPVLELALWKAKIEGEREVRVPGEHVNKLKIGDKIQAILSPIWSLLTRKRGRSGKDGGQDLSDVGRERKRLKVTKNIDQDTRLSREECRFKCGADIVIPEVLKFFAYSSSWPRLNDSEEGNAN